MKTLLVRIVATAMLLPAAVIAQIYEPSGVQQNIPVATVTGGGWTQCHLDTYDDSTSLDEILSGCDGQNLMLACRPLDSDTLTLAAWARREDVTTDTGTGENGIEHEANGVNWYFSPDWSWGFLPAGLQANKDSCDYSNDDGVPI